MLELHALKTETPVIAVSWATFRKCVSGPGYRVYFKDTGKEIVILLCGGDKSTQQEDIARARQLALLPLEELKLGD